LHTGRKYHRRIDGRHGYGTAQIKTNVKTKNLEEKKNFSFQNFSFSSKFFFCDFFLKTGFNKLSPSSHHIIQ